MKPLSTLLLACALLAAAPIANAQDGKKIKRKDALFAKPYAHKKIWKAQKWSFTKFAIHYKVVATEVAMGGKSNQNVTARSWAMLEGVSEETMQRITDNFADKFKKRMNAEFGIEVEYWNDIRDSKNVAKVVEKQDEKVFMHKGRGALLTSTADKGPWYKRVGGFIPGGKKLAKERGGAAAEMDLIIDFAAFETTINTTKDYGWQYNTITTNVKQGIVPVLHVTPMQIANTAPHAASTVVAMNEVGYMCYFTLQKPVESTLVYNTDITTHDGEMPSIMKRKFNVMKPNQVATFVVQADEAKYEAAANQALDAYLDALVDEIKGVKK